MKRGVVFMGKFEKGWLTSFSKPPAGVAPKTRKPRTPRKSRPFQWDGEEAPVDGA